MKKIKKKLIVCLTAVFLCMGLSACASNHTYKQIDITMDELEQKLEDQESFKLLIERDNCPFCEQLNEYIQETKADHGVTVYRLDVTDFDFKRENEGDTTLVSENENGKKFLEEFPYFLYTPTIYTITDGVPEQAAIGYNGEEQSMSLWDVDSTIDWDKADTIGVWEYLEE